jgi:hypothetical protein
MLAAPAREPVTHFESALQASEEPNSLTKKITASSAECNDIPSRNQPQPQSRNQKQLHQMVGQPYAQRAYFAKGYHNL